MDMIKAGVDGAMAVAGEQANALRATGISESFSRCHHKILNLVGCRKELSMLQMLLDKVNHLTHDLNLLECNAMVDVVDLIAQLKQGRVEFQSN